MEFMWKQKFAIAKISSEWSVESAMLRMMFIMFTQTFGRCRRRYCMCLYRITISKCMAHLGMFILRFASTEHSHWHPVSLVLIEPCAMMFARGSMWTVNVERPIHILIKSHRRCFSVKDMYRFLRYCMLVTWMCVCVLWMSVAKATRRTDYLYFRNSLSHRLSYFQ